MEDDKAKGHQTLELEHLNSDSTTVVIRSNEGDFVAGDTLQFLTIEEPEFGEKVVLGEIRGEEIFFLRPLNSQAAEIIGVAGLVAITIHDRLAVVEKELAQIKKGMSDDPK